MPIDGIEESFFQNTVSLGELRITRQLEKLPNTPGVYIVHRNKVSPFCLVSKSSGGWFQGRDPSNYPRARSKRIKGSCVLYIGKAAGENGLRGRVRALVEFGQGQPVGHHGGYLLWHVSRPWDLFLSWTECQSAGEIERTLILAFEGVYSRLPFANLRR
jgi:hypothetical protein